MNIRKNVLPALCGVILVGLFYYFIRAVVNKLDIFYSHTEIYLTIAFIGFITTYYFSCYRVSLILYLIMLLMFMTFRHQVDITYSVDLYLGKWLRIMWENEIVFINIFGNFFLFFPLIIILLSIKEKYFMNGLYALLIIILFEIIQLITKTGVFDLVDIILNVSGVAFGALCYKLMDMIGLQEMRKRNGTFV